MTFDADDVAAESAFWAAVFGGEIVRYGEYCEITAPDGSRPVGVQHAPGLTPLDWPSESVRAHLDVVVDDIATAHQEVLDLGAVLLQRTPGGEPFNVYRSPAGHPFCLCWTP
ncbi:glyoxalase [Pseudoclavibacter endophyticus]|nr:glyoxalase [Pseudoclavibacter endophyticus]